MFLLENVEMSGMCSRNVLSCSCIDVVHEVGLVMFESVFFVSVCMIVYMCCMFCSVFSELRVKIELDCYWLYEVLNFCVVCYRLSNGLIFRWVFLIWLNCVMG